MPEFKLIPLDKAIQTTAMNRRGRPSYEYAGYISRVAGDKAGVLVPSEGETARAVRRRLGSAAKVAGKDLVIRRVGDATYFWIAAERKERRGRGRMAA